MSIRDATSSREVTRSSGAATGETARARWPDQDRSIGRIDLEPAVRNRCKRIRHRRQDEAPLCISQLSSLPRRERSEPGMQWRGDSGGRNRAIGTHFPMVADIAARRADGRSLDG